MSTDGPNTDKPLTEAEWTRRLREINPWAEGYNVSIDLEQNRSFVAERRTACIERWQSGHEHWNDWSGNMLALQAEAERSGLWDAPKSGRGDRGYMNDATKFHVCLGRADFSNVSFTSECAQGFGGTKSASFRYFVFPHKATWTNAKFGDANEPLSSINFSNTVFHESSSFDDVVFHGPLDFSDSIMIGMADFSRSAFHAFASFGGSTFKHGATFGEVRFLASTIFSHTLFIGSTYFRHVEFSEHVSFFCARFQGTYKSEKARFHKEASFRLAYFLKDANFSMSRFHDAAYFDGAHFIRGANFAGRPGSRTRFCGVASFAIIPRHAASRARHNTLLQDRTYIEERLQQKPWVFFGGKVDFAEVEFEDSVNFDQARFEDLSIFTSAAPKKTMSFADAHFRRPPDFIGVKFIEPPRLDHMHIEDPLDWQKPRCFSRRIGTLSADERPQIRSIPNDPRLRPGHKRSWPYTSMRVARDENEHARFRKLREMAAAAKDHEQEVRNNACEIAARRFWAVSPFRKGERGTFWMGWLYQIFSDYGQSLWRPLAAWAIQLLAFAILFLWIAVEHPDPQVKPDHRWHECHSTYEVALGTARDLQSTNKIFESLALSFRDALIFDRSDVTRRMYGCLFGIQVKSNTFDYAITPRWVTAISSLQSLISAIFLFLFGLAVRNQFRMR